MSLRCACGPCVCAAGSVSPWGRLCEYHLQGSHHPNISTVKWCPGLITQCSTPSIFIGHFYDYYFLLTAPRGDQWTQASWKAVEVVQIRREAAGAVCRHGPPESIFGNKFHSHFLGTGQKVPGSGGDSVSPCPSVPRGSPHNPGGWKPK